MLDWPIRWRWCWRTPHWPSRNLSAGRKHGFHWRKRRFTSRRRTRAIPLTRQLTPRWKTSVPAARLPCPNIYATDTILARKNLVTVSATNTRTMEKIILSRRIIWVREKFITNRPSKAWKRKSRSASRNGARNFPGCAEKKNDRAKSKSRTAFHDPHRAAKNFPGGAGGGIGRIVRAAEAAVAERRHRLVFCAAAQ